jgi:prepilin-type N-terminal cleavage/methylation domain-containing protein
MRKGFTLIEMIVVLVILSIVTHLAVREMTRMKNDTLYKDAQKSFAAIKDAVFSIDEKGKPCGFVADMGRLPRGTVSTNSFNLECVTLEELWKRPAEVEPYKVRRALKENLVVEENIKNELEDPDVWIGCGWRGPYITQAFNEGVLLDVWGNRIENKDEAGYDRLFCGDSTAAKAGENIWKIAHYGSDARKDSEVTPQNMNEKDSTVEFLPLNGHSNTMIVNLLFPSDNSSSLSGNVVLKWYAPCGSSITGGVQKVSISDTASKTVALEGLPPGECMIAVSFGGKTLSRKYITLYPGGATCELKVPIR